MLTIIVFAILVLAQANEVSVHIGLQLLMVMFALLNDFIMFFAITGTLGAISSMANSIAAYAVTAKSILKENQDMMKESVYRRAK